MRHPISRVEIAALGTLTAATGVDRLARVAAERIDPDPLLRFVDQALIVFRFHGGQVYLTPTDTIALASGVVVLTRFSIWVLTPIIRALCRAFYGGRDNDRCG